MSKPSYKPIKPFLTYDQQIQHLEEDKLLIIKDHSTAKESLLNISYYALIGGYKTLFYDHMTRTYLPGTTFEDILTLYKFDDALRHLIFDYSNFIEQKLRSTMSYAFCDRYTNLQKDYLDPNHYQNTRKNRYNINKLVNILDYIANKDTDHEYTLYQRNTYGNVPLYAATKVMTFGQLSAMYSLQAHGIQVKVSRDFSTKRTALSNTDLIDYLHVLTHFRNRCAHIERLFSYKDRYDIPDTALHDKLGIGKNGNQYVCGKHDLFAVVIAYRYLLPKEEFKEFKKELIKLINKTIKKASTLTEAKLITAMGFPNNWKDISKYRV